MGKLLHALNWARRGFPVFPLVEGGKEPIHKDWPSVATTDPAVITSMWRDPVLGIERNYNIGTLCTDMVVVDIDVKEGKDGYNEYAHFGGHYDTLVVQTPTGGFHCYFNAPDSANTPLSRSIDIRSHNGFVVAPGSHLPGYGSEEYKVINDREPVWIPDTISRMLRAPHTRADVDAQFGADSPALIAAATAFLQSAPVAVQGERGDERTFVTAARLVREMGLTPQTAFCLMRDHWNERCVPPWSLDELIKKVENAEAYGTAIAGRLSPEVLFSDVRVEPPPSVVAQAGVCWGNARLPSSIQPRPWLVDRMLMRRAVTLLLAAGSAGKSSISLALAAHMSLGLDFAEHKTYKACKVIVYNGEDDVEEQSRRLVAICMTYGFDYDKVKENIMLISTNEVKMDLVRNEGRRPIRNEELVKQLTHIASDPDVGLIILDPLVKIHKCDESDNVQMDYVMETLTDLAQAANVSILALHHTSKDKSRQEERIGNMDIARGASAIVNAARVAFTLLSPSNLDIEEYGIPTEERRMWTRMDDAKMNLSLSSDRATWFRKESVKIPSLDFVGVFRHTFMEKSQQSFRLRIGRILIQNMTANGSGSITLMRACTVLKEEEPIWANKTDSDVKRRIEGMFAVETEIDQKILYVERKKDKDDKKESLMLVMR